MAQSFSLYENDISRLVNSLINQWSIAYRSQNKVQMVTVLRTAAKLSFSRGNPTYSQELIATALALLPENSPLYHLTLKDAILYSEKSPQPFESQPSALNHISRILTSL